MSTESAIVDAVHRHFDTKGVAVWREVPILGRVADVVAYRHSDAAVIAVECKVRDWTRAIRQARRYQGAAERVYVALGAIGSSSLIDQAQQHGLGLLIVDGDRVRMMIQPRTAQHYVPALGDRLSHRLAGVAVELHDAES